MASNPASSPSVEEALRSAAARFALLADVLELQALGIERADQPDGPEGSRALAETCRQAVGDLQRLLSALPVDLLNWSDAATRTGGRHLCVSNPKFSVAADYLYLTGCFPPHRSPGTHA